MRLVLRFDWMCHYQQDNHRHCHMGFPQRIQFCKSSLLHIPQLSQGFHNNAKINISDTLKIILQPTPGQQYEGVSVFSGQ
jgi:hypothetical protein